MKGDAMKKMYNCPSCKKDSVPSDWEKGVCTKVIQSDVKHYPKNEN